MAGAALPHRRAQSSAGGAQARGPATLVTGTVPDVRPYLQHAAVVVAPLRLARGIQNKILEAMAMGARWSRRARASTAIDASPGKELLAAADAVEFVRSIAALLGDAELAPRRWGGRRGSAS